MLKKTKALLDGVEVDRRQQGWVSHWALVEHIEILEDALREACERNAKLTQLHFLNAEKRYEARKKREALCQTDS